MLIILQFESSKTSPQLPGVEPSKKKFDSDNANSNLFSGAVFSSEPRTILESDFSPRYTPSPLEGSSLLKTSGTTSPIPMNYAGFHHSRRASGAFRFAQQAPTAIC